MEALEGLLERSWRLLERSWDEAVLEKGTGRTAPAESPGETSPYMRGQSPGVARLSEWGATLGLDFSSLFGPLWIDF